MTSDVLVVGAGPAGSIASLILARAGVRVLTIDRAHFPREKLCGDTLNPGALARLKHLDLAENVVARSLPVTGMIVTGPGNACVLGAYGDGVCGAAITRCVLDMELLEAATRAGATFESGLTVRAPLLTEDGTRVIGVRAATSSGAELDIRARLVIAADGRHSRLAFDLGLARYAERPRRWAFGTYFTDVTGLTTNGEMHIRADGYVGVAPVPGGLTNVCVVRDIDSSNVRGLQPEGVVDVALRTDRVLRDRFANARRAAPVTVLGPLAVEARTAGMRGLLLAGDAAGFIDPMTGDGLRFAIRGAELAAEQAMRELETGRPAYTDLAAARRREFAGKWRMNYTLRALVASPRAVRLAAALASRWQAPFKSLIVAAGDVSPVGRYP